MILDFHSHILPAMDHGSRDVVMSLAQVKLAQKAGVQVIAATPHFYPHVENVNAFLQRREKCWHSLENELPEDAPKILLGAEVLLCEGMERMEDLEQLCLPSGALLLELPFRVWNKRLLGSLMNLFERFGEQLVLAHVERYPVKEMKKLLSFGLRGQVNGSAFCSFWERIRLLSWARAGYIVALGSDTHGIGEHYANLQKAVACLGENYSAVEQTEKKLMGI